MGDEVAGLFRPFPMGVGTVGMERVGGRWRHIWVGASDGEQGQAGPLKLNTAH